MLALSIRSNESLLLKIPGYPEPVEIKVTEIFRGVIRVAINAPREIGITRKQMYGPPCPAGLKRKQSTHLGREVVRVMGLGNGRGNGGGR